MSKSSFHLDERSVSIIRRVSTVMYFVTLLMLISVLFYRQFALHQPLSEFEDIAIIVTFNTIVFISALLYVGGISFRRITPLKILAIYIVFVLLGFLFTLFKYEVLNNRLLSFAETLDKLLIVSVICGLFVLVYSLLAYFGNKRIEKKISES